MGHLVRDDEPGALACQVMADEVLQILCQDRVDFIVCCVWLVRRTEDLTGYPLQLRWNHNRSGLDCNGETLRIRQTFEEVDHQLDGCEAEVDIDERSIR